MTRNLLRRSLLSLPLLVAPNAFGSPTAHTVNVQIISASTQSGGVDIRLASVHFPSGPFGFASYKLLGEETVTLAPSKPSTVVMDHGYTLTIALLKELGGVLRLHLEVNGATPGHPIDAEYELKPHGELLVGGMKSGGETLFVRLQEP